MLAACPGSSPYPVPDAGPGAYAGVQSVVALAGADLRVLEGTRVQLDGYGSRSLQEGGALVLAWSQVGGPPVVLTNPSAPAPAFVAPLSPATLVFRLRAESGDGAAFDEVTVEVTDDAGASPFFVEVPRDVEAIPGEAVAFTAAVVGGVSGTVTLEAEARCDGDVTVTVEDDEVTVHGTRELPCLILVDAKDTEGRRSGPAARVLWPTGTAVPSETRLAAPVVAEPGALVELTFDRGRNLAETTAWPAGGTSDGLEAATPGPTVTATAPSRRTRLVVAGERRRGPASGGVRYAFVDVTAGAGNRAPTASGGSDRRVRPQASFTLSTSASSDLDGDALTLEVVQVIGPAADFDMVQPGLFHAPEGSAVLLFHVTAFDGRVFSEPDSVRVVVDPTVANEEPVLDVEPVRWVSPGRPFVLDASAAYDPDSGFIDRYTIAQDPEDDVLLLAAPVEESTVELIAGEDGDVYRFRLSAFDEEGQGAFADVEVVVEEAGPYIDAATGSDELGNGTPAAPFASLAAAIDVAVRHQLEELRLHAGSQLPFSGRIEGIDVVGGFERTGDDWVAGEGKSRLPVGPGALVLEDATLTQLSVDLTTAEASLTLEGTSTLLGAAVTEGPVHAGALLDIAPGATATLDDVTVTASSPSSSDAVLVDVRAGAALRLENATLTGGAGGARVGLLCHTATVDLIGTDVVATTGASEGTGIRATGCDIQILSSHVTGGTATQRAVGLHATDTLLYISPDTTLSGAALGSSDAATALLIDVGDAPVLLAGTAVAVEVGAATALASGLDAASSRVAVDGATISARGTVAATGILVRADGVQVSEAAVSAQSVAGLAIAVDLLQADDVVLDACTLSAVGSDAFGVRSAAPEGVSAPRLRGLIVNVTGAESAAGLALGGSRGVLVTEALVRVEVPDGGPASARAVGLRDGSVTNSGFTVTGGGEVLGLIVATGGDGAVLDRSSIVVESQGGSAVAILGGAAVDVSASFLRARGPVTAIALDARGPTTLRHATLWGDETALLGSASTAVIDAANSVLIGQTGFKRTAAAPPPAFAAFLAFSAERPWENGVGEVSSDAGELASAGCASCFSLADPRIDETGHLIGGAPHPLQDMGGLEHAVALDLDGDTVPAGTAPDLGCDELVVTP